MPNGTSTWDALTVYYYIDLTTKLTVLYLAVSVLALIVFAIRLLPTVRNLRALASSREQNDLPDESVSPGVQSFRSLPVSLGPTCDRIQAAVMSLQKWSRLTVLVLLAYSATEFSSLFRGISLNKMAGVGALTGAWAELFSMWTFAFWFLVALCLASWFLSVRLASYYNVAARFSGDEHRFKS
jgi:hypothetical protein